MASWNIEPVAGRVYDVVGRKGRFRVRITAVRGEWADGEIVSGKAHYMSGGGYTEGPGSEVTIRDMLYRLREVDAAAETCDKTS